MEGKHAGQTSKASQRRKQVRSTTSKARPGKATQQGSARRTTDWVESKAPPPPSRPKHARHITFMQAVHAVQGGHA